MQCLLRWPFYKSLQQSSDLRPVTKNHAGKISAILKVFIFIPKADLQHRFHKLRKACVYFSLTQEFYYTVEPMTNDIGWDVGYDRLSDKQVLLKFFADLSTWKRMKSNKTLVWA